MGRLRDGDCFQSTNLHHTKSLGAYGQKGEGAFTGKGLKWGEGMRFIRFPLINVKMYLKFILSKSLGAYGQKGEGAFTGKGLKWGEGMRFIRFPLN